MIVFLNCSLSNVQCELQTALQIAYILRQLLASLQLHVGFLPIGPVARKLAPPALLARKGCRAYRDNLHFEERLHGLLDFRLGGIGRYLEDQRVLDFLYAQPLFGDYRAANDCVQSRHYTASFSAAVLRASCLRFDVLFSSVSPSCSIAALEKMARS